MKALRANKHVFLLTISAVVITACSSATSTGQPAAGTTASAASTQTQAASGQLEKLYHTFISDCEENQGQCGESTINGGDQATATDAQAFCARLATDVEPVLVATGSIAANANSETVSTAAATQGADIGDGGALGNLDVNGENAASCIDSGAGLNLQGPGTFILWLAAPPVAPNYTGGEHLPFGNPCVVETRGDSGQDYTCIMSNGWGLDVQVVTPISSPALKQALDSVTADLG